MTDKEKFLKVATEYIGHNGYYVCCKKLKLGFVYDWCAFLVSSVMNDCGFIGKYIKSIEGGAGSIPRYSDGKYGTWFHAGAKAPQPGDLFFLRYGNYPTQDKYFCDHVGIVISVSDTMITTIEGNVDGVSGNWAATSTCKQKHRAINSVYAFYRPQWEHEPTPDINPTIEYQANALTMWHPYVKNLTDYAGIQGRAIYAIRCKRSDVGDIRYRVHVIGIGWLPWVKNDEDYAGRIYKDIPIDGVQVHLDSAKYVVKYRVSAKDCNYYDWITDYSGDPETGYAGEYGKPIDRLQMYIVKK